MEYRIRTIRESDNAVIESIIRSCLIEFGANHEGTAWADPDLGRFSEVYSPENSEYWVAEDERGEVIGGVGIGPLLEEKGICELQKMYCLPHARGTGVAQALLDEALAFAAGRYSSIYLETLENMVAAQRFYLKNGFIRTYEPVVDTGHYSCDVRFIRNL